MKWVRFMAMLEGSSLLILVFIGLPLKYHFGVVEAVKIIGPIHGTLFLIFVVSLISYAAKGNLSWPKTLLGLLAAFIPFGSFIFKAKFLKIV